MEHVIIIISLIPSITQKSNYAFYLSALFWNSSELKVVKRGRVRQVADLKKEKMYLIFLLILCAGDSRQPDFPAVCGPTGMGGQEHNPAWKL